MKATPGVIADHAETCEALPALAPGVATSVFADAAERMVRTGAAAVIDQGIVSATNFFTALIIARTCSKEDLGVYSLAWTIVLFLTAVQGNLISVPYTMYCHRRDDGSLSTYAGSTLVHQLITSAAAMLCFLAFAVALSLGLGPEGLQPVSWVLLGVAPFLLLREYARRFTFAHVALAAAITIDVVVAVGQLGALLSLRHYQALSVSAAYGVMGGACAAACLCWWLLNRQPIRIDYAHLLSDWRQNWSFGRWALASQLTGLAFYILPWMLMAIHGEEETGELFACNTLVGLSNLFVIGLNNYLTPRTAQAYAQGGAAALGGVLRKASLLFVAALGSLCLVAAVAGNSLAVFVYGQQYDGTGILIAVLALATFTDALGLTAGNGLWAMDRPSANFSADVVQTVGALATALCLVFPLGALGIAVALVVGRSAGAVVRWLTLWSWMASPRCKPNMAWQGKRCERTL